MWYDSRRRSLAIQKRVHRNAQHSQPTKREREGSGGGGGVQQDLPTRKGWAQPSSHRVRLVLLFRFTTRKRRARPLLSSTSAFVVVPQGGVRCSHRVVQCSRSAFVVVPVVVLTHRGATGPSSARPFVAAGVSWWCHRVGMARRPRTSACHHCPSSYFPPIPIVCSPSPHGPPCVGVVACARAAATGGHRPRPDRLGAADAKRRRGGGACASASMEDTHDGLCDSNRGWKKKKRGGVGSPCGGRLFGCVACVFFFGSHPDKPYGGNVSLLFCVVVWGV